MANYPVVVYGASGYTGMLIMDWLIDQQIPFTAVARNAKRTQEMMAQRVVRLESATYEIIEADHNVDSLTKVFKGAKVVCNTVGPFVNFGLTAVEAALEAGCHHIDTTGEQSYIRAVRDQFGELYRQAGLLRVAVDCLHVYVRRDRGRTRAGDRRHRRAGNRDAVSRPALRRRRCHGRIHGVDLRAVPRRSVLPVGEEAGAARTGHIDQRHRSGLRAAGILPALGRHLVARVPGA